MNKLEILIGLKLAEERRAGDDGVRKQDRSFGLREDVNKLTDVQKIERWLHEPFNSSCLDEAKRYGKALSWFSRLAIAAFFLMGTGAAGFAFYYDGDRPINVLLILMLFVFMPLGLLLISFITQAFRNVIKPGFRSGSGITGFWKSMLAIFAMRLSHANREKADSIQSFFKSFVNGHGDLVQTYVQKTIQKAGLAYISGALLWLVINIITTDLAFSWSSTLNMGPQHIHAVTETMSAPWKNIVPAAVVDYETVERTRYFRAWQQTIPGGATAVDLSGWWSFLLMSLIAYSFLPRLAAFAYYTTRLNKKAGSAIARSHEGQSLLARMDTPYIDTDSGNNDNSRLWEPLVENDQKPLDSLPSSCILLWNFGEYDFDIARVQYRFGIRKAEVYSLGGINSLAEDDKIIARVSGAVKDIDHKQHVIVLVEYWESADVDFEKMLKKLRDALGQKLIRIIPVAMNETDIRESNKTNWLNKINHVGDPLIRFDHDSRILLSE